MPKKTSSDASKPTAKAAQKTTGRNAETRYEKVKKILDAAAGDSAANYQGLGRFWNLPYQEFLEIEIYGIRMIA
ncbi:MAG: hypothetical protein Q8K92_22630, partial [Leadbetterella sp.]|nr:hypothetical protein [Leadbetterella sp.]